MRRGMTTTAAVCLGLLSVTAPANAARWSDPVDTGRSHLFELRIHLDNRGALVLPDLDEGRHSIVRYGRGRRPVARCRVPRRVTEASFEHRVNAAGALVVTGLEELDHGQRHQRRVMSAPAGSCFRNKGTVLPKHGTESEGWATIGPTGMVVGVFRPDLYRPWVAWSGPAGGKLVRRRGFEVPKVRGGWYGPGPSFTAGGRITWNLAMTPADDESLVQRLFAASSDPLARRVGPWRQVASTAVDERHAFALAQGVLLTSGSGAQVVAWGERDVLHVTARKPGRAFGKPRTFAEGSARTLLIRGAINAAGDAVFTWEDPSDVWALVRRRDGTLVGPQLLSTRGTKQANNPTAAIDGSGRALVAWTDQPQEGSSIEVSDIMAAMASRSGRFGPPAIVSGSDENKDHHAFAAANERGDAVVVWTREQSDRADSTVFVRR